MDLLHVWRAFQDAAPYLLMLLAALTPLAKALQVSAHALERWAAASAPEWDDSVTSYLARAADAFAAALDLLSRSLPVIGLGARAKGDR